MLSWDADPAVLRPYLPAGTELDDWNGRILASVVGFRFLRTRVLGMPVPLHQAFEEVNLRFYVRRRGPEGWRRGVVFVREIVPRAAVAAVARLVYNEPYVVRPMRSRLGPGAVEYGWRQEGRWCAVRARTAGEPRPVAPGSQEEFVTEHYWGYTRQRDGGTVEYRVEHPSWGVWPASDAALDCDPATAYGPAFAAMLASPPASAFVADGSAVTVRRGVRIA